MLFRSQFRRGNLEQLVESALKESGLAPSLLELEITESVLLQHTDTVLRTLAQLKHLGVKIAIDDFGTGYSSLARLISLPIQGVKIDRVFVSKLSDGQASAQTLLRTMLTMLRDLGLEVTAEGVETSFQRDWLVNHGSIKAQGFLFDRPIPISEAIHLLQKLDYRPKAIPVDRHRIRAVDGIAGRVFLPE